MSRTITVCLAICAWCLEFSLFAFDIRASCARAGDKDMVALVLIAILTVFGLLGVILYFVYCECEMDFPQKHSTPHQHVPTPH